VNVSTRLPGRGPLSGLARAAARRWPALVVATVAVAVPMSAAATELQPATIFQSDFYNVPAVRAVAKQLNDAVGLWAESFYGTAIYAKGGAYGVVAEGARAVKATSNVAVAVEGNGRTIGLLGSATEGARVMAFGSQSGVDGNSTNGAGVRGSSTAGAGVVAESQKGAAIVAKSQDGSGIDVTSTNGSGIFAHVDNQYGHGVMGQANGESGVGVSGAGSIGVRATSFKGTGLSASSTTGLAAQFQSGQGQAQVWLVPSTTAGAPKTGPHKRGELLLDSQGNLFLCIADSTSTIPAGTWRKVVLQ
jgi:hypothetical protein